MTLEIGNKGDRQILTYQFDCFIWSHPFPGAIITLNAETAAAIVSINCYKNILKFHLTLISPVAAEVLAARALDRK